MTYDPPICLTCGEHFHMAWLSGDPPEPYGEVCGCPDEEFADARAEKAADERDRSPIFRDDTQ